MLRFVVRQRSGLKPSDVLDAADLRTVRELLRLGRAETDRPIPLPATVEEYIGAQRWIVDARALEQVQRLIGDAPRPVSAVPSLAGVSPR